MKYKTRAEWMKNSMNAYRFALRHHLEDIATKHMPYVVEHGKWSKEAIINSAKQYKTIAEWRNAVESAYAIASRNGFLEEIRSFLSTTKKPNGYWTKERVLSSAKLFKNLSDWKKAEPSAVVIARRNRWLNEAKNSFLSI